MKTKMLNIVSMLLLLNLLVACGGESASSNKTEVQNSTVKISVEQPSVEKVYFSKIGNVDLKIASMKIYVYTTDDATDSDPSDNTLFRTKALTKSDSAWEGTLTALEKESIYIFAVSAKNANEQVIFRGATTKKVETGVNNAVDIKLAQSSDLYDDNNDVVPTANALSASKDTNGNITFSFSINNPNEESLTWSLFKEDGSTLSTEFSVNTGISNKASEFIQVTYTKDTNANNTDYVLELKSKEGKTSYAFNIDFEGETVIVTVNTPPIIESLNVVVEGDTLSITPVLDKEPNGLTYAWSFEDSDDEVITNSTEKTVIITGYNEESYLGLRLDVSQNGAIYY